MMWLRLLLLGMLVLTNEKMHMETSMDHQFIRPGQPYTLTMHVATDDTQPVALMLFLDSRLDTLSTSPACTSETHLIRCDGQTEKAPWVITATLRLTMVGDGAPLDHQIHAWINPAVGPITTWVDDALLLPIRYSVLAPLVCMDIS